jgi:hypothetical protein
MVSISKKKLVIDANNFHIHPYYSADSGQNDIALIVTDPLQFNTTIVPACLWYNTTHLPFVLRKMVFHRRSVQENSSLSVCLLHNVFLSDPIEASALDMNPMNNEDCSEYFRGNQTIDEQLFCATVDLDDGILDCKHRKREILLKALCLENCELRHGETIMHFIKHREGVSSVVVGLSSANNFCNLNKPLVFTRVSAHRKWISTFLKV